jgi:hypothetical protein
MKIKNGFLFTISLVLFVAFCYSLISQILFLSRAERGIGVVRQVRAVDSWCRGKRRHDCTKFFATVEFEFAGSRTFSDLEAGGARGHNQPLSKALHQVGDSVPILFDPNRPEEVRHDKLWDIWGSPLILLFFQAFTLLGSLTRESDTGADELVTLKLDKDS